MVYTSETVKLNNGRSMPLVGLGCWKLPNEVAATQVYEAIKLGYRLFDGAQNYENEKEVGQGIRRAIDEGIVKREDLVVVSKLWNNYHHPDNVKPAVKRILSDLGLEYLDILYIHFPIAFKYIDMNEVYPALLTSGKEDDAKNILTEENVPILDTWRAMEKLVDEGLVKSIAVSNFQGCLLQDLLRGARIRPVALQIELHPYLTQERLVEYCQKEGIQVVAYSSFGPQSFIELDMESAKTAAPLLTHDLIKSIAKSHNVEPAQVLLRWATQRGIAVIPKSSKKERLESNLRVDNEFDLTDEEMKKISGLNLNLRFNDPWTWKDQKIPTFV